MREPVPEPKPKPKPTVVAKPTHLPRKHITGTDRPNLSQNKFVLL